MKRGRFSIILMLAAMLVSCGCNKPEPPAQGDGNTEQTDPGNTENPETPGDNPGGDPSDPGTPPSGDGKIRILAIGNSFSQDAVEQYLWNLFDADGQEVIIGNLYYGGCTIDKHCDFVKNGSASYNYRKVVEGAKTDTPNATFQTALKDEEWDYISVQQASGSSGIYSTYSRLPELLGYVKQYSKSSDYTLMFHATWAYASSSNHTEFPKYGSDQMQMYSAIMSAVQQAVRDNPSISIVIPSGTAVQNGRTSYLGDTFNRDGYHLETTYGRYTAACTWFEIISGKDVRDNTYKPETVSEYDARIARAAAHAACQKKYEVTALTDYATPQTSEFKSPLYINFGDANPGLPWCTVSNPNVSDCIYLKNADGEFVDATMSIDPAFTKVFGGVGSEPDKSIVSGGVTWPKAVWARSFEIDGTLGSGDSGPATIAFSGLKTSGSYDIVILSARYNGSKSARQTLFTVTGTQSYSGEINQGIRIGSGTGQYASWDDVPFDDFTLSFSGVAPDTNGQIRIAVRGKDTGVANTNCDGIFQHSTLPLQNRCRLRENSKNC